MRKLDKRIGNKKIILLLILLLAASLRLVYLNRNPIELFGDELDAGYQSYSLLQTGRDYRGNFLPTYLQSFSEWRAPLLMYSLIPFIKLFGLNEWGVRVGPALWGLLSLIAFYWLLAKLKVSSTTRLLTLFILAISPWHIQYSRAAFELTLTTGLIISGLAILLQALIKQSNRLAILAAVLLGLSVYAYNTALVFAPLISLSLILSKLKSKEELQRHQMVLLAYSGVLLLVMSVMLGQIFLGHAAERFDKFSIIGNQDILAQVNDLRTAAQQHPLLRRIFVNRPLFWLKNIATNYANSFAADTLFGHGDVTFRHSLHFVGALFWIQLPLIIIALAKLLSAKKGIHTSDRFMLSWLLLAPIPASLTIDGGNHMSRLFYLVFPLAYFSAAGFVAIFTAVRLNKRRLLRTALLAGIAGIFLFEFSNYQYYYWVHYPRQSWRWWHYGYKQAMQAIKEQQGNYQLVLLESTYEPALIRYLFWLAIPPQEVFNLDDRFKPQAVDGYGGFCLPGRHACFVDFKGVLAAEVLRKDVLYLISQEINVPGDWDWSKSPPTGVKVLTTIRNPLNQPLFYLVAKS